VSEKGGDKMGNYVYNGLEFPTDHFFSNVFVLFAGTLERCSRRDAMDRLFFDCGGIPVDSNAAWVRFLVAARGAETTDTYKMIKEEENRGFSTILTEQEFFDTMDGNYTPPPNPNKRDVDVTFILPTGMSQEDYDASNAAEFAELRAIKRDEYLRKRKPANNRYDVLLQNDMSLRFDYNQTAMMWTALGRWGEAAQVGMAVEECAELIVALQKHTNRTPTAETLDNIADEIADVEMMLAQMRLTYGISDEMLAKRIKQKFGKLEKYLKVK
jgi:NTP pyrophosphatase (non-canonical NTP hydrolase)